MSIQYTVLGFKPMTFGTSVSSHNNKTRAPALESHSFVILTSHLFFVWVASAS